MVLLSRWDRGVQVPGSEADGGDLETGLPFSNTGVPRLCCPPEQHAETLTPDSGNVRAAEVVMKQD